MTSEIHQQHLQNKQLLQEKSELERALYSVQETLQTTNTEKEQLHKVFMDFKTHYETVQSQASVYQKRLIEEMNARKSLEDQFEQRLNQMAQVIEKKQNELENVAQKMQLPIDTDILRMRLAKDLEAKYRFELQQKMQQLESTSDSLYEAKRQLELLKIAHESLKLDSEKQQHEMRARTREEINNLAEENQRLQLEIDDQKDQESNRKLKRELDDQKRRLVESQIEIGELRKERDLIKMERNDLIVKQAKEIDEERCQRRYIQAESDKLKLKVKILEEEVHKYSLRAERKSQEAASESKEKTSLLTALKEKDLQLDSMRRQMNQLKEDLHQQEIEYDTVQRRLAADDKQRSVLDQQDQSRLRRELDTLERNYADLECQRKRDLQSLQDELKQSQGLITKLQRERDEAASSEAITVNKMKDLQKLFQEKQVQFDSLNKDFNKVQERLRGLMGSESALSTQKEQLEANKRFQEGEQGKLQQVIEAKEQGWNLERQDLNHKLQEMLSYNEKVRDECLKKVVAYKEKYTDYKSKVKSANQQIQRLMQRVARYELHEKEMEMESDESK